MPCYLTDVSVDEDGFIADFAVAYLPDDVNPEEIKRALRDALNLDEPHCCQLYDAEDRYLAGHPGTPSQRRHRGRPEGIRGEPPNGDNETPNGN